MKQFQITSFRIVNGETHNDKWFGTQFAKLKPIVTRIGLYRQRFVRTLPQFITYRYWPVFSMLCCLAAGPSALLVDNFRFSWPFKRIIIHINIKLARQLPLQNRKE